MIESAMQWMDRHYLITGITCVALICLADFIGDALGRWYYGKDKCEP